MPAASNPNPLRALSAGLSEIVAAAAPSVVSVHSHRSLSSGFIWKGGLIVTADEALAEEGEIAVTLAGGERVAAAIVGRDPTTDVAVIRIEKADLPPVALDGAPPAVGALAVAVAGRDGRAIAALAMVAVSAPAWQSIRGGDIDARIELDVAPYRRHEGGLAVDADGRAFGVVVFGPQRRVQVIPSATILRVASQLEASGKIARGYLGLGLQPVQIHGEREVGAMVMSVDSKGPAAKAGIHQGDVIRSFEGKPIASVGGLQRALGPASVGATLTLGLNRGGEAKTVKLVVGERPSA
ncbi:MAG: trypsin-like peptidase domain-containing protein [Alphaproteobacteria bacterium]|nr:trypsin-like peptidase domain-containing protein [Alphaproteobacteria bacterium]